MTVKIAQSKGFKKGVRFTSASGLLNCLITDLKLREDGSIVSLNGGVIYYKPTNEWGKIE